MERIAWRRIATWCRAGWRECATDWSQVLPFGGVAVALLVAVEVLTATATVALQPVKAGAVGNGLGLLLVFIANGAIACGLTGVALGSLHEREPTWRDFLSSDGAFLQALLAWAFSAAAAGLLALLPAAIFGAMAVAEVWRAYQAASPPSDGVVFSLLTGALCFLAVFLLLAPLRLFVIPLCLDKRMDLVSAVLASADCARRDYGGLLAFTALLALLYALAVGCCPILVILLGPLHYQIIAFAYRDYFSLSEDRHGALLPEPARVDPELYDSLILPKPEPAAAPQSNFDYLDQWAGPPRTIAPPPPRNAPPAPSPAPPATPPPQRPAFPFAPQKENVAHSPPAESDASPPTPPSSPKAPEPSS